MIAITPVEKRALAVLAGVFSLRMLGLFMLLPVLPLYASQLNGVTPTLVGVALGIYGLSQAAFQLPFGFLSDRIGRRKIIVFGFVLLMFGSVIAATADSIYGVIAGRALQGMGAVGCVIMALVSDLTREEIRIRAMAVLGITIGLSFVLALLLGPILSGIGGIQGIFWITALLALVAIPVLLVFVPCPQKIVFNAAVNPVVAEIPKVLFNKKLGSIHFGVCVLHASLVAFFLKVPLALERYGFTEGTSWKFYLPMFVCALIGTVPCLWLMEKQKSAKSFLAFIVLLLLVAQLGIGYFLTHGLVGLALSVGLFFIAFNTLEASLPSLVSKMAPAAARGTALGIYSSSQFLGIFLGGSIGGWLDTHYGTVGVLAFCLLLGIQWFLWILRED